MRSFVRSVGESKRPPSVAEPNGPSWATTPSLHSCSRVRRAGRPVSCAVRLTRRVPRIERLGRRYLVGCRSSCRRRRRRRRCQRELCCAARCARASRLAGGDSRGACSSRQPNRAKPSPTSLVCRWCVPVWARWMAVVKPVGPAGVARLNNSCPLPARTRTYLHRQKHKPRCAFIAPVVQYRTLYMQYIIPPADQGSSQAGCSC